MDLAQREFALQLASLSVTETQHVETAVRLRNYSFALALIDRVVLDLHVLSDTLHDEIKSQKEKE